MGTGNNGSRGLFADFGEAFRKAVDAVEAFPKRLEEAAADFEERVAAFEDRATEAFNDWSVRLEDLWTDMTPSEPEVREWSDALLESLATEVWPNEQHRPHNAASMLRTVVSVYEDSDSDKVVLLWGFLHGKMDPSMTESLHRTFGELSLAVVAMQRRRQDGTDLDEMLEGSSFARDVEQPTEPVAAPAVDEQPSDEVLYTDALDLRSATRTYLQEYFGYRGSKFESMTIEQFAEYPEATVAEIPYIGPARLAEIKEALAAQGLKLA